MSKHDGLCRGTGPRYPPSIYLLYVINIPLRYRDDLLLVGMVGMFMLQ